MAIAEIVGSMGGMTCDMWTSGGVLVCACIMAVLRVMIAADRLAWLVAFTIMSFIRCLAESLGMDVDVTQLLTGKVGIILHVLGTTFVVNVSAAMIVTMARFLQSADAGKRSAGLRLCQIEYANMYCLLEMCIEDEERLGTLVNVSLSTSSMV